MSRIHNHAFLVCEDDSLEDADIFFYCSLEYAQLRHPGYYVEAKPQYDQYVPQGYVPRLTLIEDGWYWPCTGCDVQLNPVNCIDIDPDDYNEFEEYPHALEDGKRVFCSPECKATYDALEPERQRKQIMKRQAIVWLKAKYPGITPIGTFFQHNILKVDFRFPGGYCSATWDSRNPDEVLIAGQDVTNWFKYTNPELADKDIAKLAIAAWSA